MKSFGLIAVSLTRYKFYTNILARCPRDTDSGSGKLFLLKRRYYRHTPRNYAKTVGPNQPGIAWLTFHRSEIRIAVRLRCRLCTMISRDPYIKGYGPKFS